MQLIGVTGGIGSGKSIVCKIFEILGIPVYYADSRAKWLINNNSQLRKEIKELLGRQAYDHTGAYNRKWVAELVFNEPSLLKMLNQLVHPRVYEDTENWIKTHSNQAYLLKEAAISNAAGDGNNLDKLIWVSAPIEIRVERIKQRDHQRTEHEIMNIISQQKTDQAFQEIADFQVINDNRHLLIPQVLALHKQFST